MSSLRATHLESFPSCGSRLEWPMPALSLCCTHLWNAARVSMRWIQPLVAQHIINVGINGQVGSVGRRVRAVPGRTLPLLCSSTVFVAKTLYLPCFVFPLPSWLRHCLCLVFPLPSRLRHCLCHVFPLPSWLRHCPPLNFQGWCVFAKVSPCK